MEIMKLVEKKSIGWKEKANVVLSTYVVNLLWIVALIFLLSAVFGTGNAMGFLRSGIGASYNLLPEFFMSCLFAPLWEELAFRYVPITIARNAGHKYILPIVVGSSIFFGVLHGGVINILIQGVGGILMSYVYIKNGYCYWSSTAYHFLWNAMLVIGFPMLMG